MSNTQISALWYHYTRLMHGTRQMSKMNIMELLIFVHVFPQIWNVTEPIHPDDYDLQSLSPLPLMHQSMSPPTPPGSDKHQVDCHNSQSESPPNLYTVYNVRIPLENISKKISCHSPPGGLWEPCQNPLGCAGRAGVSHWLVHWSWLSDIHSILGDYPTLGVDVNATTWEYIFVLSCT